MSWRRLFDLFFEGRSPQNPVELTGPPRQSSDVVLNCGNFLSEAVIQN